MKILKALCVVLILMNITLLIYSLSKEDQNTFEEITVERINVVEEDGTLKLALFNSHRPGGGLDADKRQGAGTISGMLFYNEEGHEMGSILFDGKAIEGGQQTGMVMTFDGYRQDQTLVLRHDEKKNDSISYYEDGLLVTSRPDRSNVREEYDFYELKYPERFGDENTPRFSKRALDSMELELAKEYKVATRRVYLGHKRGDTGNGWFDDSGLFIKNKYGKDMIKIYVDKNNIPRFEVLDTLGKAVKHNLIPEIEN